MRNCSILCPFPIKDSKDKSLIQALDEIWKKEYDEGRFHLLDGLIYHRTKHTCVITVVDRSLVNCVLKECHESPFSGQNKAESQHRYMVTNLAKDVEEYCKTIERFQKENKSTGKRLGIRENVVSIAGD
ncbi:hypothetical protein O181_099280 [Austropuccinia psidii MF-1]|uniref:Uncharacterized protein n=1 Tax=Austropuccinia psidii MF-1 TaxID=1389203 RepID=A0A9Q3PFR4_9BASI|nr:hypothetical protein [Austropuccinia psidii MF-1]